MYSSNHVEMNRSMSSSSIAADSLAGMLPTGRISPSPDATCPVVTTSRGKGISNAADNMQQLLEKLLELSRIGRLVNPPEEILLGELAREAALQLAYEYEIFTELIIPTQLAPFQAPMQAILASVEQTQRLLVAEEGTISLGWGAEILARATEAFGPHLKAARRVASKDIPTPASTVLEKSALPDVGDIVRNVQDMFF